MQPSQSQQAGVLPQSAAFTLRVSCATPVAGPVLGVLGVGLASAMAGQASQVCQRRLEAGSLRAARPKAVAMRVHDLALDALLGVAAFRVRPCQCHARSACLHALHISVQAA